MSLPAVSEGDAEISYMERARDRASFRKLLLICLGFPPSRGGIQRFLGNFCGSYSRLGPLVVLAPRVPGCFEFDRLQPYRIYRYPSCYTQSKQTTKIAMLLDSLRVLAFAGYLIKREGIDIICCGEASLALLFPAVVLHFLFKVPWYSFAYGTDFLHVTSRWQRRLLCQLSRTAAGIMVDSEYARVRFVNFTGIDTHRTYVVYPGLDPLFIERALTEKAEKPVDNSCRILLTVGRLVERKGQDMVIRALPKIISHIPNLKYRIVGEGPYRTRLEQLAKELGVDTYVEFIGAVEDTELIREYKSCDLFIMPSRESPNDAEGFGIVYLEANACGKPVIGGRSGGVPEAVLDNQTGLLTNPTDVEEIANSVVRLLNDPLLAKRLGEQGKERVLKEFTSNYMAERVLRLISENS